MIQNHVDFKKRGPSRPRAYCQFNITDWSRALYPLVLQTHGQGHAWAHMSGNERAWVGMKAHEYACVLIHALCVPAHAYTHVEGWKPARMNKKFQHIFGTLQKPKPVKMKVSAEFKSKGTHVHRSPGRLRTWSCFPERKQHVGIKTGGLVEHTRNTATSPPSFCSLASAPTPSRHIQIENWRFVLWKSWTAPSRGRGSAPGRKEGDTPSPTPDGPLIWALGSLSLPLHSLQTWESSLTPLSPSLDTDFISKSCWLYLQDTFPMQLLFTTLIAATLVKLPSLCVSPGYWNSLLTGLLTLVLLPTIPWGCYSLRSQSDSLKSKVRSCPSGWYFVTTLFCTQ